MDLFQPIFITFGFLHAASHFTLEISVLTDERMNMDLGYRNEKHSETQQTLTVYRADYKGVSIVNAQII